MKDDFNTADGHDSRCFIVAQIMTIFILYPPMKWDMLNKAERRGFSLFIQYQPQGFTNSTLGSQDKEVDTVFEPAAIQGSFVTDAGFCDATV